MKKATPKKRTVIIRVPQDFLDEIDQVARRRRISRTALLTAALERALLEYPQEKAPASTRTRR
jgi:metal-responsive CopG/Arc/MetJ family transcriptional regulator